MFYFRNFNLEKMKKKIFIALSFMSPFLFISCNQKVEKQYYETGEVYKTEKRISEHETEVHTYFKNGNIVEEGIMYDSLREGQWNDYYNDGVLRGELIFNKGKVVKENIKYPIRLDFKDNPAEFKTGNSYQFRVLGISFFYSLVTPKKLGYRRILIDDFNDAQYLDEITPEIAGDYAIKVIIEDFEPPYNEIDTVYFPIKVVD